MDPGSKQGSPRGCRSPVCNAGRTSPRTCGTQRHSPLPRLPFGDAEVRAVHGYRAVVEHVVHAQPALKEDLCLRGGGQRRGG